MRRTIVLAAIVFGISAVGADCTGVESLSNTADESECGPDGCFSTDAQLDAGASDVSTDIGTDGASMPVRPGNPLCGELRCNPDSLDPNDCSLLNSEGADDDAGTKWPPASDDAGSAGDAPHHKSPAPSNDPEDAGTMGTDGQDELTACRVIRSPIGDRTTTCLAAGEGTDGAPCVTSEDCAPGHACVTYGSSTGVCRRYCCLDSNSCPEDTFCAPRKTKDTGNDGVGDSVLVPVCVPTTPCNLVADPGQKSGCQNGKICAVVRSSGATGCVLPGEAQEGEPCDDTSIEVTGRSACAAGLVCSRSSNKCLRFCLTGQDGACGEDGFCQGGAMGIPAPYGVCVPNR